MPGRWTRREFIAFLAGVVGFFPVFRGHAGDIHSAGQVEERLGRYYAHSSLSAMIVGSCYLQQVTKECTSSMLAESILRDSGYGTHELKALTDTELFEFLRRRISLDFEAGRTVHVDSWLLSETECRLCALRVLSSH
ncbi:MAG: hypothetical protein ACWGOW_00120 [Gammaproteobacteria bacterium]